MVHVNMYCKRRAGTVTSAWPEWGGSPPCFGSKRRMSQAQRAGIAYEKKVLAMLSERFGLFLSHLPFRFTAEFGTERCIPDGIILSPGDRSLLTVVEVKHRHTADAWFQLKQLYLPVVRAAFPRHRIQLLEICKCYDPAVNLPEEQELVEDLVKYVVEGGHSLAVYSWSGKA